MTLAILAWRTLLRQPARAVLGVFGVAAVAALLFDMLLLAGGLATSFRDLLDSTGFDVRVTATEALPGMGPYLEGVRDLVADIDELDHVADVAAVALGTIAARGSEDQDAISLPIQGYLGTVRGGWKVLEGDDLPREPASSGTVVINRAAAEQLDLDPGDELLLGGLKIRDRWSAPPQRCRITGIVEFVFEQGHTPSAAMDLDTMEGLAGRKPDRAAFLMVSSAPASADIETVQAIRDRFPNLHAYSNAQYVQQFQAHDFSYFRQIAVVISTLTVFFTFLLLTALLTVSVNQRLGEVAGLRALGFRRRRIVAMLMWETAVTVVVGLVLAVAVGAALAVVLDGILHDMPGLPDRLHFFVYRHGVLVRFVGLILGTGLLSLVYPAWIAARLPIAATLRKEITT